MQRRRDDGRTRLAPCRGDVCPDSGRAHDLDSLGRRRGRKRVHRVANRVALPDPGRPGSRAAVRVRPAPEVPDQQAPHRRVKRQEWDPGSHLKTEIEQGDNSQNAY